MATWKSPLFSDIRNKLGENVVFSMWKGRPYMRSFVTPANPNTLAQQANRDQMAKIVELYQTNIKGTPANVAAWDVEALKDLVSGYNQFTKYGRGTVIGAVDLSATTISIAITRSTIPADRLAVMVYDLSAATYLLPTSKRGLGPYTEADYSGWTPAAGDLLYIVDTKVLVSPDVEATAKLYKAVSHWKVNETTGVADALVVT